MAATRIVAVAVLVLFLGVVADANRASATDQPTTRVLALGCYLEIPASYLFNTRERGHFTWYSTGLGISERIDIYDLPAELVTDNDPIDTRQEGRLTIRTFELPNTNGGSPLPFDLRRYLAISSDTQALILWGGAKEHAGRIIDSCLANPAPR